MKVQRNKIPPLTFSSLFLGSSEVVCCGYLVDTDDTVTLTAGASCTEFEDLFCYEIYGNDKCV